MTPAVTRRVLRWGHLAASGTIGLYLYSPWSADPIISAVVLYGVFPVMAVSGLWMWNQGLINRWLKGHQT
jgi:hypothetical protein